MKPSCAHALPLFLLLLLAPAGCTNHSSSPPTTTSPDGVPCVNLPADRVDLLMASAPAHPLILRGVARALQDGRSSSLNSLFLSEAYAFPLEAEQPLQGARIDLFEVPRAPLPDVSSLKQPLLSATSDAQGRYCLVLPHEVTRDALFLLVATPAQADLPPLRQLITHSFDPHLNAMSEAFTRAISPHLSARLTDQQILNVRTLGETRLGLLSPDLLDGIRTQEALIERAVERLQHDEAIQAALSPE